MSYDLLFSPMNIGTMSLKNRVIMTAAEFSLGQTNGQPTQKMIDYYVERAKGGVAMITPGMTIPMKMPFCMPCVGNQPSWTPKSS